MAELHDTIFQDVYVSEYRARYVCSCGESFSDTAVTKELAKYNSFRALLAHKTSKDHNVTADQRILTELGRELGKKVINTP